MDEKILFIQNCIEEAKNCTEESQKEKKVKEIISVFSHEIENIRGGISLYGTNVLDNPKHYEYDNDLKILTKKLENYMYNLKCKKDEMALEMQRNQININNSSNNTNNNSNTLSLSVTFEEVREKIRNIDYLNDEDIEEINDKINKIEEISKSNDRKATKWDKVKPILKWLLDKSVDIGISLLPLILQVLS